MVKTAICYFSGSGNSFDIALELCKYIDVESIFYIPNLDTKKLNAFDEVIIVAPVYQFNIPKPVQDFIRSLEFDLRYYVVLNYGFALGKSKSTIKKLFKQNRLKLAQIQKVKMPLAFTVKFTQPKFTVNNILKRSRKKIRTIAYRIYKNENKNINLKHIKKIKRYIGYSLLANDLSLNSECTRCQRCIDLCPVNNIRLYQGNIEFGDRCIGCLGCYNRCDAVEYKGRKKKIYVNSNIDFRLMK